MSSNDSGHRRFEFSRVRGPGLSAFPRIVLGSLAIAAIILAFASRPGLDAQDLPRAAPDAKPTYIAAAAVVPLPTAVAAATPLPVPSTQDRVHVVESGDTLTAIAKRYYGDASKWQKVLDANKDVLKGSDSLQLGQKLKIPE
jgi:nucleoid-associated protein YgaU